LPALCLKIFSAECAGNAEKRIWGWGIEEEENLSPRRNTKELRKSLGFLALPWMGCMHRPEVFNSHALKVLIMLPEAHGIADLEFIFYSPTAINFGVVRL